MSDNLELWNRLKQPPKSALKAIGGGRLKGKTDINPQWRYEAITREFGPCGVGWYYTVDSSYQGTQDSQGQIPYFAEVSVYTRLGEGKNGEPIWSAPIQGVGGSMLIEKERNGLHLNDEALKMAVTDALSVALKMLGVAADIYAGLWDGSKYRKRPEEGQDKGAGKKASAKPPESPQGEQKTDPEEKASSELTDDEKKKEAIHWLQQECERQGIGYDTLQTYCNRTFKCGIESLKLDPLRVLGRDLLKGKVSG